MAACSNARNDVFRLYEGMTMHPQCHEHSTDLLLWSYVHVGVYEITSPRPAANDAQEPIVTLVSFLLLLPALQAGDDLRVLRTYVHTYIHVPVVSGVRVSLRGNAMHVRVLRLHR